ncbi:MAG: response regulator [Candidatus Eisenbacteria bacterium]|nr:response regulator [Candidatus Latescibacterota bacterium]MBD3300966.1 response regulator [Candidatus Eisenbacteria bacterium]
MPKILCVESEPTASVVLEEALARCGHLAVQAATPEEATRLVEREPIDLIISEHRMPEGSGLRLLDLLRRGGHRIPVILTNRDASVEDAVRCLRCGAVDYLPKPINGEALRGAVQSALVICRHEDEEPGDHPGGPGTPSVLDQIIGESPALTRVREMVQTVAATRATVLLEGESGTGKELLARAIHELSPRIHKPFVVVNCAALPEGLVESTLFGHERGAFTGATSRMPGAFERAHLGTLLLDEISEMRIDLQAKLLRAVQEQQFERVGGTRPVRVDVRIVATTNQNMLEEIEKGRFRSDLYYRLSVVPVRIPSLRERKTDIPLLLRRFAARTATELGIRPPTVSEETAHALAAYPWPGNIRELENAVERAVILCRTDKIPYEAFQLAETKRPAGHATDRREDGLADLDLKRIEKMAIQRALERTNGHRSRAAHLLGISDRTLRNKLNGRDKERCGDACCSSDESR